MSHIYYFGVDHPDKIILTYWGGIDGHENICSYIHEVLTTTAHGNIKKFIEHMVYDRKNNESSISLTIIKKDDYNLEDMINNDFRTFTNYYGYTVDDTPIYILKNKKWHVYDPSSGYILIPMVNKYADLSGVIKND